MVDWSVLLGLADKLGVILLLAGLAYAFVRRLIVPGWVVEELLKERQTRLEELERLKKRKAKTDATD